MTETPEMPEAPADDFADIAERLAAVPPIIVPEDETTQAVDPNIARRISAIVESAFENVTKVHPGENIQHMLFFGAQQDQQGNIAPYFGLTLAIPSMLVGQMVHGTAIFGNLWITQSEMEGVMTQMIDNLMVGRAQQAQQAMAAQNGAVTPPA